MRKRKAPADTSFTAGAFASKSSSRSPEFLEQVRRFIRAKAAAIADYGFRTGRSYVVYAYRETTSRRLTTGICSRTRPANDAEEDLSYLRTRNDRARRSGIEGYAFRLKRDRNGDTHWDSYVEGVTLVVESGAQSWELKTGKEGKFALWKLAPGTYHLRGSDPNAHIVSVTPPSVELPAKGCAHVIVMLTPEWRPARR